jgi:hypothetical protein
MGQKVAERYEVLASSRRATGFPIFWRTKRTKRTKELVKGRADRDGSTELHAGAARESKSVAPRGSVQPLDLASRRVYSRNAERYWLLRSGDDELRFTLRSAAERWASGLADRGISSELTWHDENIASAMPADRRVA